MFQGQLCMVDVCILVVTDTCSRASCVLLMCVFWLLQTHVTGPAHEFQRDGITICTTFTPFKPENTRLLARKNDIIIDIRVMYDHSKGKTLILSKNISLLVTIKGV